MTRGPSTFSITRTDANSSYASPRAPHARDSEAAAVPDTCIAVAVAVGAVRTRCVRPQHVGDIRASQASVAEVGSSEVRVREIRICETRETEKGEVDPSTTEV